MIRGCKFWPNASRGCIIFSTPVKRRRRTNPTTSPDSLPLLSHEHSRLRARAYLWHPMDFACNTLFRKDLDQSPCSVASLPSFARTMMRMKDRIGTGRKRKKFIPFQCFDARSHGSSRLEFSRFDARLIRDEAKENGTQSYRDSK